MFFQNIKQFILKNKKSLLFLSFLILALFPDISFADEVTNKDSDVLTIINAFIESA